MIFSLLTAFFLSEANAGWGWWALFTLILAGQIALAVFGIVGTIIKKR